MTVDPGCMPALLRRWRAQCPDGWVNIGGDENGWCVSLCGSRIIYPLLRDHQSSSLHAALLMAAKVLTELESDL